MKRLATAIVVSGLFGLTALPAQSSGKLSGAELKKIIPGAYTISVYGFAIRFNVRKGGTLKATFQDTSDTGKWSVRGDKLCISFKTWTDGKPSCSNIRYDGKKWFTADDGTRFTAY